jgi:hypothetical protein
MTVPAMPEYPENYEGPQESPERSPELHEAIAEARAMAREQVFAAWQMHLDRVREQLESGWREAVDEIFEERFAEVEQKLGESFESAVSTRAAAMAEQTAMYVKSTARRDLADWLNQTARRLKQSETREVWIHSMLDAAATFSGKVAFFMAGQKGLRLEGMRGGDRPESAVSAEVPIASAPAFANAIESKDTVVTIGTPRELSQTITSMLGDASERRVYLFPIVLRQNAVAVLYAEPDGDYVDVSALELLVSLASSSIETTESVTVTQQPGDLVRISGASAAPAPARTSWAELSKSDQEVHLRAQRFARTRVAQFLLHKVNQVRAGRASNDLYGALRGDIDAGREAFRRQFLETCPSMVDYYHLELVRTLARDNVDALGPEYPGAMAR